MIDWRADYGRSGLAGLDDRPRSGRPRVVDRQKIIATTLLPPPKKYGVTHWSSRLLAAHQIASLLLTPLSAHGTPLGVLQFGHRTHRRWSVQDLHQARLLAVHLTPLLARLHNAGADQ